MTDATGIRDLAGSSQSSAPTLRSAWTPARHLLERVAWTVGRARRECDGQSRNLCARQARAAGAFATNLNDQPAALVEIVRGLRLQRHLLDCWFVGARRRRNRPKQTRRGSEIHPACEEVDVTEHPLRQPPLSLVGVS